MLSAFCLAAAALWPATEARAQGSLAGVTPRFPYAPAVPASLGGQPPGNNVQWLGADGGSLAVFPDGTTTFWSFGDTFLGPAGATDRRVTAPTVVNTIALATVSQGQLNPTYFFRGQVSASVNPSSFFLDPDRYSDSPNIMPGTAKDVYSPNNTANPYPNQGNNAAYYDGNGNGPYLYSTDCSRLWTGKAIFWPKTGSYTDRKLFVFFNRVDYSGVAFLGNYVARVENPVNAMGGANDPRLWNITYLKLSYVSTAGWTQPINSAKYPASLYPTPWYIAGSDDSLHIGAEAFVGQDWNDTEPSMYAFATVKDSSPIKNTIIKIPMSRMLAPKAPQGATDISPYIQYMSTGSGQWTAVGTPGGQVPTASVQDAHIPAAGLYTCRLLPDGTWRNVFVDASQGSKSISVRTSSVSPFGPWSASQTLYNCPELITTNAPFDVFHLDKYNNNLGIYINQNPAKQAPSATCYMGQELPEFSTATQMAAIYSCTRDTDKAYPSSCPLPPMNPPPSSSSGYPWYFWDNNFYRVKGILETPQ